MVTLDEDLHRTTPDRRRSRDVSVDFPPSVFVIESRIGVESEQQGLVRDFLGDKLEPWRRHKIQNDQLRPFENDNKHFSPLSGRIHSKVSPRRGLKGFRVTRYLLPPYVEIAKTATRVRRSIGSEAATARSRSSVYSSSSAMRCSAEIGSFVVTGSEIFDKSCFATAT